MKTPATKFNLDTANIEDVTRKALETVNRLEDGSIHFAMAKEITNAIGKTINSIKVRLEYAALRKEKPEIAFLNVAVKK